MFIIELEKGVWKASVQGDPGRTLVKENATKFETRHGAKVALGKARNYREFRYAKVEEV